MRKYFKIDVTRTSSSEIYVRMPDGTTVKSLMFYSHIGQAAKETASEDYNWDDHDWPATVEIQGVKEVPEQEATEFTVFDGEKQ